jgi:uncharacterized transporter YbjL
VKLPRHDWLDAAPEVQTAVTITLSGVDPQLGNAAGLTVIEIVLGWLETACKVTGATV